ncbi:MAG: SagB/ThcOx family dehydrogenase [Phycisphaerae bacterium]|jgi:SagB-type dehydrogenase family enzyme
MMRTLRFVVPVLLALAVTVICLAQATTQPAGATTQPAQATTKPAVALPPPVTKGTMSLEEALAARRSIRKFVPTPLTIEQIGQLCWAAQGVTEPKRGLRTAPSAMARYPLELYVVTAQGASHYLPAKHALETVIEGDALATLRASAGRQPAVAQAPAVFVITAVPSRFGGRSGGRTQQFIELEVGHAAQNLLLEAVALGLGAVPVGGFSDADVAKVLQLPAGQTVCYLIPVGVPAK